MRSCELAAFYNQKIRQGRAYSNDGAKNGAFTEIPTGKRNTKGDRNAALKDHGPRDIAHGERIFAVSGPDDAVDFLWQLGSDWRNYQGQNQGRCAYSFGQIFHMIDKESCTTYDTAKAKDDLRHDQAQSLGASAK